MPANTKTDVLTELEWRGLLHQLSDADGLRAHLATGTRTAYAGFDPTADSLTIGNLVPLMVLSHLQSAGHNVIVIAGGGTGLIGDPGGRSAERPLLSLEAVVANVESQKRIYQALLPGADVVNNADWLSEVRFIELLRDVGKHFSVNEMVRRDSVRNRLESEHGISYTEFSYMLLQAYDFSHLYRTRGVTVQIGGSDQWGNIVSGVDLIRRQHSAEAFAVTNPLITKSDGGKFGKSEAGAVWLTADRTSPYAFHQFWLNSDDADVVKYLKYFTFLTEPEIVELEAEHRRDPGARTAQRMLANDVTTRLHGADASTRAESAGRALFSGDVGNLDAETLREVFTDVPSSTHPHSQLDGDGVDPVELLVAVGLASSKRDARQHLDAGSITVNGNRIDGSTRLRADRLLHGTTMLLRRGRKAWHLTRWE